MRLTSLKASRYEPKTRYFWIKDKGFYFYLLFLWARKGAKKEEQI